MKNRLSCTLLLLSFFAQANQSYSYQPSVYNGLNNITGKILYPGDMIIVTFHNFVVQDTVKDYMGAILGEMQAPGVDPRFFYCNQVAATSVADTQSVPGKVIMQYFVTNKYIAKTVLSLKNNIFCSLYTGINFSTQLLDIASVKQKNVFIYTSTPIVNLGEYQNESFYLNFVPHESAEIVISPSPNGFIPPPDTLFEKNKFVRSEEDLKTKSLYTGDIFAIKKNGMTYNNGQQSAYQYIYIAHRDWFESYENYDDPGVQNTTNVNSGAFQSTQYFKIKDNIIITEKITLPYAVFEYDMNVSYLKFIRAGTLTILPLPNCFSMVQNSVELTTILRKCLMDNNGLNADSQDTNGRTLLMWSIFYEDQRLIRYFLNDSVLTLNLADKDGRTALMYAAQQNNQEIVDLILAKAESLPYVTLQDHDGMTMLHYAVWNNNYAIVNAILSNKFASQVINAVNKWKVSPLMYAAAQGNKKIVQLLLNNNADATLVDINGFNCLTYACMSLNVELVNYLYKQLLVQNQNNALNFLNSLAIDQTNLIYNTLLVGQNDNDFFEVIQFLLQQGVSTECSYNSQQATSLQSYLQSPQMQRGEGSILEMACSKGNGAAKTIKALLYAKAKITPKVIAIAQQNGILDIIKSYSIEAGPLLYKALYDGDTASALELAQQFSPQTPYASYVANYTNSGWSLLLLLATQAQGANAANYTMIAKELLARGANVNVTQADAQGNPITPLGLAINNGNTQLQTLLQNAHSIASQAIANSIIINSSATGALIPKNVQTQIQTSELITGKQFPVDYSAVSESIDNYGSLEYLLG